MSEMPWWEQRAQSDARILEDEVRRAGPEGLTRQQLKDLAMMGKDRFEQAVRILAERQRVACTGEPRHDRRGHLRAQVVLRHMAAEPAGTVPARVSRDPAVRQALDELALIEAVARAKEAGRRKPRAIARWILAQPFTNVSRWIDVEGPLTARIEQLEGANP